MREPSVKNAVEVSYIKLVEGAIGLHYRLFDRLKTTVFLADFGDFQKMNEVYATYFTNNPPARSTVGVSTLPKNARVEIEVIAVAGADGKSIDDTSG